MKTVHVFNSYSCLMNRTAHFWPSPFALWPSSGRSFNPLWVHGWSSAQWQHGTDSPLLCYLYCGSNFPRFHTDAIRFRWFTHQKGKAAPRRQQLFAFMCKWGSLGLDGDHALAHTDWGCFPQAQSQCRSSSSYSCIESKIPTWRHLKSWG